MIIIVAPYPDPKIPQNGFLARISYIDKVFGNEEKVYLWPDSKLTSFKPRHGKIDSNTKQAFVNPFNPVHIIWIIRLSLKARLCYFHSVYQSLKLFYLFIFKKCIVDLHGIAPEELKMMGDHRQSARVALAERFAMRFAYKVISVTEVMAEYIQNKYPRHKIDFIILPIFENKKQVKSRDDIKKLLSNSKLPVIYSGTASIWQAVDKIVDLVKSTSTKYSYTILTPDQDIFNEKINDKNVVITGVPKDEVYKYYAKNILGIVIRNDSVVNKVSCPTKLIEYMATSVLPIVEYTEIGDFKKLGYKYLTLEEIKSQKIPDEKTIREMLMLNHSLVDKYEDVTQKGIKALQDLL